MPLTAPLVADTVVLPTLAVVAKPFVPGHEGVGRVVAVGERVKSRHVGHVVGIGWYVGTCGHCAPCVAGEQHLCQSSTQTIVGNHGCYADRIRLDALWAIPILWCLITGMTLWTLRAPEAFLAPAAAAIALLAIRLRRG